MIGLDLLRRLRSRERSSGQAMIEFALVTPILFVMVIGIFEAGRLVFYNELLANASREGARYAIVHGARSDCPSGPPPPLETNQCDPSGQNVKLAVQDAALDMVSVGDLFVFDPVWTSRGSLSNPLPGDSSTGHNARGEYVTVFVDFTYEPLAAAILDIPLLPEITLSAESTLVINT